jgi:hypothetical protein
MRPRNMPLFHLTGNGGFYDFHGESLRIETERSATVLHPREAPSTSK